jgi:hypothetical protein
MMWSPVSGAAAEERPKSALSGDVLLSEVVTVPSPVGLTVELSSTLDHNGVADHEPVAWSWSGTRI